MNTAWRMPLLIIISQGAKTKEGIKRLGERGSGPKNVYTCK
jgi:hypothetical protein